MATTKKNTTTKKTANQIIDEVKTAVPQDAKIAQVKQEAQEKAVKDSKALTIENVSQSLTKVGLDISKTLQSVRELFETQISNLQVIEDAIAAKQAELETLYDKEVISASLSELVLEYNRKKDELLRDIAEARENWDHESDEHRKLVLERDRFVSKSRAQEQEDFDYQLRIKRRNDEESFKETVAKRTKALQDAEDAKRKLWEAREEEILKSEKIIADNKSKLDNFDALVEAAVNKQVAAATASIKAKYDTDSKIAKLEFDNTQKILSHEKSVLAELVQAKDRELVELRKLIQSREAEVREVAVAALNAQSGQAALKAVQEAVQSTGSKK